MTQDRRTFLRTTGAAVSAAAVGACTPGSPSTEPGATSTRALDEALLQAVGTVVLPSELGRDERERVVEAFQGWAADYRAVPELNHGYGTPEIRYGPPDAVPAWGSQLQALDLEATKRYGMGFAALDPPLRDALVRRHIEDEGPGMPGPLRARHVAVALLSFWLSTPEATDRCYGVLISPRTCRGIESAPHEPGDVA